ncbi:aspartyl protease family protein 1 [Cyclospora cayetanensis]|uniref:Aspartyl protease family protein 1 n=1 Tax=Cyclospora cayetanensis TaxID=88456 RepID=A0A6P6S438_9EIME|nr:aspartyl protease family protein 1 [Cyclospora cayetanensis]
MKTYSCGPATLCRSPSLPAKPLAAVAAVLPLAASLLCSTIPAAAVSESAAAGSEGVAVSHESSVVGMPSSGTAAAAAAAGGDLGAYSSGSLPAALPKVMRVRLFGSMFSYAYYFLDVMVGTPPQRESVILDTGSSLLAFPCSGCEYCGTHLDSLFNPALSSTGMWVDCRDTLKCFGTCGGRQRLGAPAGSNSCGYTQTYSEGSSISGIYFSDKVSIGAADQHNPSIRYDFIGCHVRETSLFVTQKASGIFGVSFPKGFRQPTLIDVIFQQGLVRDKLFSICISEDGGLLTVGGIEPGLVDYNVTLGSSRVSPSSRSSESLVEGDKAVEDTGRAPEEALKGAPPLGTSPDPMPLIAWTSFTSRAAYRVQIAQMEADGVVLGRGESSFGKTLVDSGTTYSYFPPAVFAAWRQVLNKYCSPALFCQREKDGRPCWRATSDSFLASQLPVIKLTFQEGQSISWAPQSYLYRRTGGFWCDGLDDNHAQESVLGLSFFKHKQIIFDREEHRLGAINARCPNYFLEERPQPPDGGRRLNLPRAQLRNPSTYAALERCEPVPTDRKATFGRVSRTDCLSLEPCTGSTCPHLRLFEARNLGFAAQGFHTVCRCCRRDGKCGEGAACSGKL